MCFIVVLDCLAVVAVSDSLRCIDVLYSRRGPAAAAATV